MNQIRWMFSFICEKSVHICTNICTYKKYINNTNKFYKQKSCFRANDTNEIIMSYYFILEKVITELMH